MTGFAKRAAVAPRLLAKPVIGNSSRSEEHTSEPSHDQISYAVFCLKKKNDRLQIPARGWRTLRSAPADGFDIHPPSRPERDPPAAYPHAASRRFARTGRIA